MSDPADPALLEESAEALYENAPCGYLSTLPNGTIAKINQTLLDWMGYARGEVMGRRFQELLSVAGRIYTETHLDPLLHMQGSVSEVALNIVCRDGSRLPVMINIVQRRDETGRPLGNRITVFNARDRRRYERELLAERRRAEQAAQTKADFLSMVSHEIRTPLSAILGVAHLLDRPGVTAQQAKLIRILRSSCDNLLNLVNEILDYSKIEAGRMEIEARSLSLRDLVYETASRLDVRAREKGLDLRVDAGDEVPAWLEGDPGKLSQVLTNMIANAIKFTSTGSVTVGARLQAATATHATVEIDVTDTGIGIRPERLSTIFDAFTQGGADVSNRYGGTGLGLAISQRLLAMHGSELKVESTLGEGSRFWFVLTLPKADPPAEPPVASEETSDLRGVRLLVAEDNPINVFVVSRCLEDWGLDYDVVSNGREAVSRVQTSRYHLVLMDLQMPEMDGYEAAQAIRQLPDEDLAGLPMIAVSASTRIGEQDKVALAGFDDFLGKPYEPRTLLDRIKRLVGSRGPASGVSPPQSDTHRIPAAFNLETLPAQASGELETGLVQLVRRELVTLGPKLQDALMRRDEALFRSLADRSRASLNLLAASVLWSAIERGLRLLRSGADEDALAAARLNIAWSIEEIVTALDAADHR